MIGGSHVYWPKDLLFIAAKASTDVKMVAIRMSLSGLNRASCPLSRRKGDSSLSICGCGRGTSDMTDCAAHACGKHPGEMHSILQDISPKSGIQTSESAHPFGGVFTGGSGAGMNAPAITVLGSRPFAVVTSPYNEGPVISSTVLLVKRRIGPVVAADEGSIDGTAEIARLAGTDVICVPKTSGKTKAMTAGFARALDPTVMLNGGKVTG